MTKFEEVEVVRPFCLDCQTTSGTGSLVCAYCHKGTRMIELRGVDRRPIPRKVKRRELMTSFGNDFSAMPKGATCWCEWEEIKP